MIVALAIPPPSHVVLQPIPTAELLERVDQRRHDAAP
jgi:hypothetical protein